MKKPYNFLNNYSENGSVDKKYMAHSISKKLNNKISYKNCLSIVYILIDEIKEHLLAGKELHIPNLGKISLQKVTPRLNINIVTNKKRKTKPSKALKFKIDKKFSRFLIRYLDHNKTFK